MEADPFLDAQPHLIRMAQTFLSPSTVSLCELVAPLSLDTDTDAVQTGRSLVDLSDPRILGNLNFARFAESFLSPKAESVCDAMLGREMGVHAAILQTGLSLLDLPSNLDADGVQVSRW